MAGIEHGKRSASARSRARCTLPAQRAGIAAHMPPMRRHRTSPPDACAAATPQNTFPLPRTAAAGVPLKHVVPNDCTAPLIECEWQGHPPRRCIAVIRLGADHSAGDPPQPTCRPLHDCACTSATA